MLTEQRKKEKKTKGSVFRVAAQLKNIVFRKLYVDYY